MGTLLNPSLTDTHRFRDRCYDCFRPKAACFCATIPTIHNQTEIVIVQHLRERFHPFNTARIVHKALQNSQLYVDYTHQLARSVRFDRHAGVLYPGPNATLISELPEEQRPRQLVILDGTWANTKTLMRDIPALHNLPQYQLAPASPSRYRIRREPGAMFISTLEATVEVLRILEPQTRGLEQLIAAFDYMIDGQLAHARPVDGVRHNLRRVRASRNIPWVLQKEIQNVVVAYGECAHLDPDSIRGPRFPLVWVAERMDTGERFTAAIQPPYMLSDSFLSHLELPPEFFANALSLSEVRRQWQEFIRPRDTVAVFNPGSAKLLAHFSDDADRCLVLKSVDFNPQRRYSTLEDAIGGEQLVATPPTVPGRAGRRLANLRTFVQHLHRLGDIEEPPIDAP